MLWPPKQLTSTQYSSAQSVCSSTQRHLAAFLFLQAPIAEAGKYCQDFSTNNVNRINTCAQHIINGRKVLSNPTKLISQLLYLTIVSWFSNHFLDFVNCIFHHWGSVFAYIWKKQHRTMKQIRLLLFCFLKKKIINFEIISNKLKVF